MLKETFWFDILTTLVFLAAAFMFFLVIRGGRRLAAKGFSHRVLEDKKGMLTGVTCTMLLGAGMILVRAFITGGHDKASIVHYGAVAVFLVSFILMRTTHTGLRRPRQHRILAMYCSVGLILGLLTGFGQMWIP